MFGIGEKRSWLPKCHCFVVITRSRLQHHISTWPYQHILILKDWQDVKSLHSLFSGYCKQHLSDFSMKLFLRYCLLLSPDTTSHHLRMKNNPLFIAILRPDLDEGRALVCLGRRRKPRDFASCADKDVDRSTTNSQVLTWSAAAFQTCVNGGGTELPVEADVCRVSGTALGLHGVFRQTKYFST